MMNWAEHFQVLYRLTGHDVFYLQSSKVEIQVEYTLGTNRPFYLPGNSSGNRYLTALELNKQLLNIEKIELAGSYTQ